MTAAVTIHPRADLTPGRYLLDTDGRLQPMRYRGFVRVAAIVTVRAKKVTDPVMAEFGEALGRVRARRGASADKPKVDGARLAEAFKARAAVPKPEPKIRPKRQALSGEECTFCGVPGFRGCDHFLPFVPGVTK